MSRTQELRPKPCQVKAGRRKSENGIPGQDWLGESDETDAAHRNSECRISAADLTKDWFAVLAKKRESGQLGLGGD